MIKAFGYAAQDATTPLAPFSFERRDLRERDVQIETLYCGVCHSDLHTVRGEWGGTHYPSLPGHEIVGRVTRVGPGVQKYRTGDLVGCVVKSSTCSPLRLWRVLNFCDKYGIVSEIEIIPTQKIDEANEHLPRDDVKYRSVIDMASLKRDAAAA